MDTSSSTTRVRVTNAAAPWRTGSWLWILLVLTLLGPLAASAQDAPEPEPAIKAPMAPRALALDAAVAGDKLIAVGERGHILTSGDGGATWRQAEVPTRAALTGVYFHDENLGWVVGHDGVILRTTDGGLSWELVNWAPEDEAPFFDIWFSDENNGIAIGAYGAYWETTDGGVSWSSRWISDDDWHLHSIARAGNGKLYIAAEAGSIYRSDDGGTEWVTLPSLYEGSYFGVLPLDDDSVLVFGLRGHLYRSEDAGETWQEIDTGTVAMLTDGIRLADGTIVIVGLGGTILVSADGGQSFTSHARSNRRGISAVVDAGEGRLLLVGEFGVRVAAFDDLVKNGE